MANTRHRRSLIAVGLSAFSIGWLLSQNTVSYIPETDLTRTLSLLAANRTDIAAVPSNASPDQAQCLLSSGFIWKPFTTTHTWKVMCIEGSANAARGSPLGFQRRCSWVFTTAPPARIVWGQPELQPSTVFIRPDYIRDFLQKVLPCLSVSARFVLTIGDDDSTVPRQLDERYGRGVYYDGTWERLLGDARIVKVFAEHLDLLDERFGHRVAAIPMGVNSNEFPGRDADFILRYVPAAQESDILKRPLKVLQVDRRRQGPQWRDRAVVHEWCSSNWKEFCVTNQSQPGPDFFGLVQSYPFMLCVHGGGIDPNPKAWDALLLGTIPIIQHFPGIEIYRGLPVVIVDFWAPHTLSQDRLQMWRDKLAPYYTDPVKRSRVLQMLGSDFWWSRVTAALSGRLDESYSRVPTIAASWRE